MALQGKPLREKHGGDENDRSEALELSLSGSMDDTANMPGLAVDPSGDAFAIWTRGAEVRVNRFE